MVKREVTKGHHDKMLHDSRATQVIGAIFGVEYDGVKNFVIWGHLKRRSGQVRSKKVKFWT